MVQVTQGAMVGACEGRGCDGEAYPQAGALQESGRYLCPGCGGGPLDPGARLAAQLDRPLATLRGRRAGENCGQRKGEH